MKKNLIYVIGAVLAGVLLGYLFFGRNAGPSGTPGGESADTHQHGSSQSETMWTCSMHPQIMQPEPGSCPICGMDLIPAAASDPMGPGQFSMTENAMALANIRTLRIGEGTEAGERRLQLSGTIEANVDANAIQASYFDGRIEQLFVTYPGQQIRKGQRLASIYAPGLVAAQQELLTAAPLKEKQPALYRAVRNKLRNWKLSEAQIDEIESTGRVTEQFPIYATVSGTVTEVMTAEGDYVQSGQPIARLSNLSTVWAELDAYENQLDFFRLGQAVRIESNAYPGRHYDATVTFIDPILNSKTRTATVRATLPNAEGIFKPGMFISASVQAAGQKADRLTIPVSAVLWTGERSVVYVKPNPNEVVFEMREVRLGNRLGEEYEILEGLEPGEEVVAQGAFTVDAAAQLKGKKSMMNREGGSGGNFHSGHGQMGQSGTDAGDTAPTGNTVGHEEWPRDLVQAYPELLGAYLDLKDALVQSTPEGAARAAGRMAEALPGSSQDDHPAVQSTLQGLRGHLKRLRDASGDLGGQRSEFLQLSGLLIGLGAPPPSIQDTLFVQYCPMADDFNGAYWISREAEIRNPYFGDAMLTCGEIRETWTGDRSD